MAGCQDYGLTATLHGVPVSALALRWSLNGSPTCHRVRFFLPLFQVLPLFEWNLLGSKAVNFRPIMTARGLLLQTLNSVKRISFWRPILYFGLVQRELKQNGPKYKLTHSPPFSPLPFLCKISSPLSAVSELFQLFLNYCTPIMRDIFFLASLN